MRHSAIDSAIDPTSVALNVALTPLREPAGVGLRARPCPGATPSDVQERLEEAVCMPLRSPPCVTLEELDGDEVVVRIAGTPAQPADGPRLASEVPEPISPIAAPAAPPS